MSKRTITFPDGKQIRVNAPADADDEEVYSFALYSLISDEVKEREKLTAAIEKMSADLQTAIAGMKEASKKLDRLEIIEDRKSKEKPAPAPVVQAPVVKVNPEVKVISDPAIVQALAENRKAADDNAKLMRAVLETVTKAPDAVSHEARPGKWVFDVQHDTDQRSPRFGRMTRVIATSGE